MLTRRGVLVEDVGQIWLAEPDADGEEGGTLRPLQAAAISFQAAPGQWPGPSPGTNSPLDCSCPGSALSDERVQLNASGQVELKLETPWRDGTTHLVMSPLEFMQRLAALVPRPRLHLIRFQGVPAPNAKLRFLVVPSPLPHKHRPLLRRQTQTAARTRRFRPGRTASIGRGCSSVCSTSTCSNARTAAAASSRSSWPSSSDRWSRRP